MSLKACAGRLCSKRRFLCRNLPVKPGPFRGEKTLFKKKRHCASLFEELHAVHVVELFVIVGWGGMGVPVGFFRVVGPLSSHHVSCVMSGKSDKRYDDACVASNGANASHGGRIEEASMNQSINHLSLLGVGLLGWCSPTSPSARHRRTRGPPAFMSENFCRSKPSFQGNFAGLPRTT